MSTRSSVTSRTKDPESEQQLWSTPTPPNDEEIALPLEQEKKELDGKDPNLVGWDGEGDPENPRNWSMGYKNWITFQLSMLALAASMGSSIIAPGENAIAQYVGVSREVTVLAISLYM